MHADRTNRSMLTLLGLLSLAAGVAGLLASTGVFGTSFAHKALFANRVSRFVGDHGVLVWAGAAVVGAVIALLALWWLRALLFSGDRAADLRVAGDRRGGTTTILPVAVTDAVVREIQTYRSVASAKARLIGDESSPTLVVAVTVLQNADVAAVRARLEAEAFAHVRRALDRPELPILLDLDLSRSSLTRV